MRGLGRHLGLRGPFSVGVHREVSSSPWSKAGLLAGETKFQGLTVSTWLCELKSLLLPGPQFPHLYHQPLAWIISKSLSSLHQLKPKVPWGP